MDYLSRLDFNDDVRVGNGRVADLLMTFSVSMLSIALLDRGTEGWVLAAKKVYIKILVTLVVGQQQEQLILVTVQAD